MEISHRFSSFKRVGKPQIHLTPFTLQQLSILNHLHQSSLEETAFKLTILWDVSRRSAVILIGKSGRSIQWLIFQVQNLRLRLGPAVQALNSIHSTTAMFRHLIGRPVVEVILKLQRILYSTIMVKITQLGRSRVLHLKSLKNALKKLLWSLLTSQVHRLAPKGLVFSSRLLGRMNRSRKA